jgi:hypothetical protein
MTVIRTFIIWDPELKNEAFLYRQAEIKRHRPSLDCITARRNIFQESVKTDRIFKAVSKAVIC